MSTLENAGMLRFDLLKITDGKSHVVQSSIKSLLSEPGYQVQEAFDAGRRLRDACAHIGRIHGMQAIFKSYVKDSDGGYKERYFFLDFDDDRGDMTLLNNLKNVLDGPMRGHPEEGQKIKKLVEFLIRSEENE